MYDGNLMKKKMQKTLNSRFYRRWDDEEFLIHNRLQKRRMDDGLFADNTNEYVSRKI